jgi:hypothetical protein
MSTKKIIIELMKKLERSTDPDETEDLEDQILRLADQEEDFINFTNKELKEEVIEEKILDEIDDKEIIRLQRAYQREVREANYHSDSKLESVDEELLRSKLMSEALVYNEDFAFKKSKKNFGAKNKSKKR